MAYKYYVPVKCTNTECAYPLRTCEWCFCNVNRYGKNAVKTKDPKKFYKFVREVNANRFK